MSEAVAGNLGECYPRGLWGQEAAVLGLWRSGFDTLSIARIVGVAEADVYNKLPAIRERAKQNDDWNFDRGVSGMDNVRGSDACGGQA